MLKFIVGAFFALAGPVVLIYAGWWLALDRPAYHIGWCPVCVGWGPGANTKITAYADAEKAAQARARTVEAHQAAVTAQAATHDTVAQTVIVTQTRTIIKEVPTYVTAATDARFPLSVGFVRLHDAGALGLDMPLVTDRAGQPDGSASSVPPSGLAAIIASNYGQCRADAQQLADLEQWVRDEGMAPK